MKTIKAKPISYSATKRDKKNIRYIVIHYTSGANDTAENEGYYFARANTRAAGAHFFVDRAGTIVKSIDMNRTAWSVGGSKYNDCVKTGGGKFYGKVTNANSVSIELCAIANKWPSDKQIRAVVKLLKYIRKHCPNAKTVVRHFDVTGKHCPATMMAKTAWNRFLYEIGE